LETGRGSDEPPQWKKDAGRITDWIDARDIRIALERPVADS
jgi:hypothetical protein